MTDPATITGGPSEAAASAAAVAFRDAPEDAQAPWRSALAAAYAVDEPRIRADQTRRIVAGLRESLGWLEDEDYARWVANTFGVSA